jgi:hypothetical protein
MFASMSGSVAFDTLKFVEKLEASPALRRRRPPKLSPRP